MGFLSLIANFMLLSNIIIIYAPAAIFIHFYRRYLTMWLFLTTILLKMQLLYSRSAERRSDGHQRGAVSRHQHRHHVQVHDHQRLLPDQEVTRYLLLSLICRQFRTDRQFPLMYGQVMIFSRAIIRYC